MSALPPIARTLELLVLKDLVIIFSVLGAQQLIVEECLLSPK